jgi:hypothetical protein
MQAEQATQTIQDFMSENKIVVKWTGSCNPPEGWARGTRGFDGFVECEGKGIPQSFEYYIGPAHNYPQAEGLIECLIQDTRSAFDYSSFEDWADCFGYDQDSRKAEKIYQACKKNAKKLLKCLGMSKDRFLKATENIEF